MTISIKPTASGSTIEQDGSSILSVDASGNLTVSNEIKDANGQILSNTPAFSAKVSSNQNITESISTKIQFDTLDFDTDNAFDTSTYTFTVPTGKAGKYAFNITGRIDAQANTTLARCILYIYKGGAAHKRVYNYFSTNYIRANSLSMSAIMDLAEGDEISGYAFIDTTNDTAGFLNSLTYTYFDGHKLIT